MSVKLFVTATKSINSAYDSKRLGFAGMRVTLQPLTWRRESFPHSARPAGLLRCRVNDHATAKRQTTEFAPVNVHLPENC